MLHLKAFAINLIVWIGLERKSKALCQGACVGFRTLKRKYGTSKVGTTVSQTANQVINLFE
jgi:hypothetical protein